LGSKPSPHIKTFSSEEGAEEVVFKKLEGLPLNPRRTDPKFFLSSSAPDGYRVIFGTFDFKEALHGAILLDPEGKAVHTWVVSQEDLEWEHKKDTNVFPHGFEIAPDGSIVVTFDEGNALTKYDFGGNIAWRVKGNFHHSIHFEGTDSIWCWQTSMDPSAPGVLLVKLDYGTGRLLKAIHFDSVVMRIPISTFSASGRWTARRDPTGRMIIGTPTILNRFLKSMQPFSRTSNRATSW
jgi:hypothetical protein